MAPETCRDDAEIKKTIITVSGSEGIEQSVDISSVMEPRILKFYAESGIKIKHPNHIVGQVLYFIEKLGEIKSSGDDEKLKEFYSEFVSRNQKQGRLIDLLDAAYHLRIESLWELMSKVVADMITGKTYEEISKMFKLENDITYEEMGYRNEIQEW